MPLRYLAASVTTFVLGIGAFFGLGSSQANPVTGKITLGGTVSSHFRGGARPGDMETWQFSLSSTRSDGKTFGYGVMTCTYITDETSVRECDGTFSLPKGKIMVQGSFLYPILFQFAVVGGTDLYERVGGVMSAVQLANKHYTFKFEL